MPYFNELLFPLNCIEDLKKFNTQLEERSKLDAVAVHVSQQGGKNLNCALSRMMNVIMTDEVCSETNWTGSGSKTSFNKNCTNIVTLMWESVKRNTDTYDATKAKVEVYIRCWLLQYKERLGIKNKAKGNKEAPTD